MEYDWFGKINSRISNSWSDLNLYPGSIYYMRVYQENNRLRFEALDHPYSPTPNRTFISHNVKGMHKLIFYLDDVRVTQETTFKIARQIFDVMGWGSNPE